MKNYNSNRSADKGHAGEERLSTWFYENGITYLPLKQTADSFTHRFADSAKRPDFFVLLESLGMLAVDAKNCTLSNGYFTLMLDEVKKAIAFEMFTRLPFWFLFLHESGGVTSWCWISSTSALESGVVRTNHKTNSKFLAISLQDFVRVQTYADMGKLYNHRQRFTGRIFEKF